MTPNHTELVEKLESLQQNSTWIGTQSHQIAERLERFRYLERHMLKRARKFRRRVKPLIRRIDKARSALSMGEDR